MLHIILGALFTALVLVVGAVYWRRRRSVDHAAVCHQYVYLFKGGFLSESALESARVALEPMLQRGDPAAVDALFRSGKQFAVFSRALCEIGTEPARQTLERQLARTFAADPLEQAWYQLDLVRNLRRLNRLESIAPLLQAASGPESPLSHFLAAEAASAPGFGGALYADDEAISHAARLVLLRALRAVRNGVEPRLIAVARLGEAVEILWDQRHVEFDPRTVRVLAEARRLVVRAPQIDRWFGEEENGRTAFHCQLMRLQALDELAGEYLDDAAAPLRSRLVDAPPEEQSEILRALIDLRIDAVDLVRPMLDAGQLRDVTGGIESLAGTRDATTGPWFCDWVRRHAPPGRRPAPGFPYPAALRALRFFPSESAEALLLDAFGRRDPVVRRAALSSAGWWSPVRANAILARLKEARFDRSPVLLQAAQAALARLGERHALRWFRQQLIGESSESVHRIIKLIAEEGLLLLWPDLDALADAEDGDVAFHARDALEQLREELNFSAAPRRFDPPR